MRTKFIEASQGKNWGKFAVCRFDEEERARRSAIPGQPSLPLLQACGWWSNEYVWVLDLQTGEGAYFRPGGSARADLEKHAIWVCPMFEPFLEWLYRQDLEELDMLPAYVEIPDAPFALSGRRRQGPRDETGRG
jgi:hypothetical protein